MRKTALCAVLLTTIFITFSSVDVFSMGKKAPPVEDKSIEGRIAAEFNVEKPVVLNLKNSGFNDEEIIRLLFLYITTETPIVQLTDLYKQGTKWADIAQKQEVDPALFDLETTRRMNYLGIINQTIPAEIIEPPEKPGKGGNRLKPDK